MGIDLASTQLKSPLGAMPIVLMAGGTIGMCGTPDIQGAEGDLLWPVVLQDRYRLFEGAPDSSCFRTEHWHTICDRVIDEAQKRPVILTHGTDTLEQTTFLLSLLGRGRLKHPVIVTGAWTPPDQPGSDAAENLLNSLCVAIDPQTPAGVYAVIGREIHHGARIKKVATAPQIMRGLRHSYFESVGGPVGIVLEDKVFFPESFLESLKYFSRLPPFFSPPTLPQPVKIRIRSSGRMVLPSRWYLEYQKGAIIGTVDRKDIPQLMDPIKASLKFGLLLSLYAPDQAITMMRENIAGEITQHGLSVFDLPQIPQREDRVQVIVANQFTTHEDIYEAISKLGKTCSQKTEGLPENIQRDPLLRAIAESVQQGVDIVMSANATQSPTDLETYRVGKLLKLAGARDSEGLSLKDLLTQRPDHPRLIIIGSGSGHLPLQI